MIHHSRARILLRIHRRSTHKVESETCRLSFSNSMDVPLTRTQTQDPFVRRQFAPACLLLPDTGHSHARYSALNKKTSGQFSRSPAFRRADQFFVKKISP